MACTSFLSVSVEAVNIYKVTKVDTNTRSECCILSCAWKAPRVLSGSLASTIQHRSASRDKDGLRRIRGRNSRCHCSHVICSDEFPSLGESCDEHVDVKDSKMFIRLRTRARTRWRLYCSSYSSPVHSDTVSIKTLWKGLKPSISYLPAEQLRRVKDALKLAFEAHAGQKRRSGEPFIIHPVEVARILGELELDWESITAGLLHDTVEDSNVSFERIEEEFGPVVRRIVEGETKVSKLGKLQCANLRNSVQDVKANDLRQMFLAMTEEVRVIIVKLADRLHNMRTLSHMPQHKQRSIASETLKIFAPLAKLLGMYQIKSELETLSFMYTNPVDFAVLKKKVEQLQKGQEQELSEAKKILIKKIEEDRFLDFMTMDVEVISACKELYSIYKMLLETKGAAYTKDSIAEVNEIAQLRIILKPRPCVQVAPALCSAQQICYHVLGLVHGIWTPIPQAMKDYIATPKPNGYQSLQTKVIPFVKESMFRVEVQIRTDEMDQIAERGIALHYSGKGMISGSNGSARSNGRKPRGKNIHLNNIDIARRVSWLNAIREWQEEFVGNMSPREFVDTVTVDLLGSRVFVFTLKGEIKNLPKGATVIDYAYQKDTEDGNKMVAAKVNGNLVDPGHTLANAEVVEIITYNVIIDDTEVECKGLLSKTNFQRHQQWLKYAKTRSARHKIMKFLKEQASLSANEITADTINNFVADLEDSEQDVKDDFDKSIIQSSELPTARDLLKEKESFLGGRESLTRKAKYDHLQPVKNTLVSVPKINGKHNKLLENIGLKINGESECSRKRATSFKLNAPRLNEEILSRLEVWKAGKVASWHGLQRTSTLWFNVCCINQKDIFAEITSVLAAAGIMICACVAESDQTQGLGVILFHVDGDVESMVKACSSVDSIEGVLSWSVGCSWEVPQSSSKCIFEC